MIKKIIGALAITAGLLASGGESTAAGEEAPCPNSEIRAEQNANHLPDCRAWEMVSPVEKNGGAMMGFGSRASSDGDQIVGASTASFGDSVTGGRVNHYLFSRAEQKWDVTGISPPRDTALIPYATGILAISESADKAIAYTRASLTPEAPAGAASLYVRDNVDETFDLITPRAPGGFASLFYEPELQGANRDFTSVVFRSSHPQVDDAPDGVPSLYQWQDGEVQLISRLPGSDAPSPTGGSLGDAGSFYKTERNALSADGDRVYLTMDGDLFLRENGITELIAPDAVFSHATPDGNFVFYTTGTGLYRYEPSSGTTIQLDEDEEPDDPPVPGAEALAEISEDGQRAYFVDDSQLVEGAPIVPGATGYLYVWDHGQVKLIAPMPTVDATSGAADFAEVLGVPLRDSTPEGDRFAFISAGQLTDHPTSNPSGCLNDEARPMPTTDCPQLYVYDLGAETLECASCRPGYPSKSIVGTTPFPFTTSSTVDPRLISDDGRYVFFRTADPLVPEDMNGRIDAYQWKNGAASLLSSGRADVNSYYMDAGADGRDAYIISQEQLVGQDVDELADIYNVRRGGGLGSQRGERVEVPCDGGTCLPEGPEPPPGTTPGSIGLHGAGNPGKSSHKHCEALERRVKRAQRRAKRTRAQIRRLKQRRNQGASQRVKRLKRKKQRLRTKTQALKTRVRECNREVGR